MPGPLLGHCALINLHRSWLLKCAMIDKAPWMIDLFTSHASDFHNTTSPNYSPHEPQTFVHSRPQCIRWHERTRNAVKPPLKWLSAPPKHDNVSRRLHGGQPRSGNVSVRDARSGYTKTTERWWIHDSWRHCFTKAHWLWLCQGKSGMGPAAVRGCDCSRTSPSESTRR